MRSLSTTPHSLLRKAALDLLEKFSIDNGFVLALVDLASIVDLSKIESVLQHVSERSNNSIADVSFLLRPQTR